MSCFHWTTLPPGTCKFGRFLPSIDIDDHQSCIKFRVSQRLQASPCDVCVSCDKNWWLNVKVF